MMVTRSDIITTARQYLGVRWHHQGRHRTAGLDCIGLVLIVAQDLGLAVPEQVADYGRVPDGQRLRNGLAQYLTRTSDPQPGDVLLMRFERDPQHVAIMTDTGLIHAAALMRKVVEHRIDVTWRGRILSAWTWPGIDGEVSHG